MTASAVLEPQFWNHKAQALSEMDSVQIQLCTFLNLWLHL